MDLAGITTPDLKDSFELCRAVNRKTDPQACLAVELLPLQTRPYAHALYAFGKTCDDTADEGPAHLREHAFSQWRAETLEDLRKGQSAHPLRKALVHTVCLWGLDVGLIDELLAMLALESKRIAEFTTFEDLRRHLHASAMFLMLSLPLLEPVGPQAHSERLVSLLGEVVHLIDDVRDFPIDLPKGRYYIPLEDLERFGILKGDLLSRKPSPQLDALVRYQLDRARQMLNESAGIVSLVHPSSRSFVELVVTGQHAYLDEFNRQQSEVFWHSVELPLPASLVAGVAPAQQPQRARARALSAEAPANRAPARHPSGARPPDFPPEALPRHVAVIMDGNGRWATARGRPRAAGFSPGGEAALDLIDGALEIGIAHLSLYAFSTENWSRPSDEIAGLFDLASKMIRRHLQRLHEHGVQVRWSGRRDRIPPALRAQIVSAEAYTHDNGKLILTLCFDYGGRAEIVDAARRLAMDAADGRLDPGETSEGSFQHYLYEPDLPDVDLLIRTSGEKRISNFLLWQTAYAELVFDDVLWPDFDRSHFWRAIEEFVGRDRRRGDCRSRQIQGA